MSRTMLVSSTPTTTKTPSLWNINNNHNNNDNDDEDEVLVAWQQIAIESHQATLEKSQQLLHKIQETKQQQPPPSPSIFLSTMLTYYSTTTTTTTTSTTTPLDHPIAHAMACSDSILHSLTKIASGGSMASQEIKSLEQSKAHIDKQAQALAQALQLRQDSDQAQRACQAQHWMGAASSLRRYLDWKKECENKEKDDNDDHDHDNEDHDDDIQEQCRTYVGEYALRQLENTYQQVQQQVLQLFQTAVTQGDLKAVGQFTPVLSELYLDQPAVQLYLRFLKSVVQQAMTQAMEQSSGSQHGGGGGSTSGTTTPALHVVMARMYNIAVNSLRHHLPMVSHCLYRADGDVAVVQLVHVQTEQAVLPLLSRYQTDQQLAHVSQAAARVYAALEERYAGRSWVDQDTGGANSAIAETADCGFAVSLGSLVDVDAAMEETALCLQHGESYLRFMHHTCQEVNKARKIRFDQDQRAQSLERERQGWASGRVVNHDDDGHDDRDMVEEYQDMVILADSTPLHQALAELGGQYAVIERCLLLASMQRAFVASDMDPRYYRPLSLSSTDHGAGGSKNEALQTSMVDTCFFAARRGTQRALATGHTGTASAMTNFTVDCLTGVLLEVLTNRAEESGVAMLKPGEGLLVGSAGIFNASNLLRQGTQHVGSAVAGSHKQDGHVRQLETRQGIARACATLNDLEVAVHHTQQLENLLMETAQKGFPPGHHDTEQLIMCVKSLRTVVDSFKLASNATIELLESVLKPRVRSIVGEAIGSESSSAAAFMSSSVMGGHKTSDKVKVQMNYNLDDESYNLLQLSEGYVNRLCTLLDDLLDPLRTNLAPHLWDTLLLYVLSTVAKRLETSLRKCEFTSLGALALDSDVRDLLAYSKDRLFSPTYSSNVIVAKACAPLGRLLQIAKLLNVDDLEDVLDLISSSKRKKNWDLKLDDTKEFLSARVEFDAGQVNELLRMPEDD